MIKLKHLYKKYLRTRLLLMILRCKRFNFKNVIIITSEGRSGSTWLMEILANMPKTVLNWEPLHVTNGVLPKTYNLGRYPYLLPEQNNKGFKILFENILRYKRFNTWTISHLSIKNLMRSQYVLTKFVRANSLLPWMITTYKGQLRHKPILLLRHPIPTCISQIKNFLSTQNSYLLKEISNEVYTAPKCENNFRYLKNEAYINTLKTPLERQIAFWCIHNIEVLKQNKKQDWITVYYESLVLEPKQEVIKILDALNLPFSRDFLETINFRKQSTSDFLRTYDEDSRRQLESFLDILDPEILQRIQNIFDHYNLLHYNAFSAYPIIKT